MPAWGKYKMQTNALKNTKYNYMYRFLRDDEYFKIQSYF